MLARVKYIYRVKYKSYIYCGFGVILGFGVWGLGFALKAASGGHEGLAEPLIIELL